MIKQNTMKFLLDKIIYKYDTQYNLIIGIL